MIELTTKQKVKISIGYLSNLIKKEEHLNEKERVEATIDQAYKLIEELKIWESEVKSKI